MHKKLHGMDLTMRCHNILLADGVTVLLADMVLQFAVQAETGLSH